MAHVISVCSSKGGVGKTTSVINLSHGICLDGHRTLLVDSDIQSSCRAWQTYRESELDSEVGFELIEIKSAELNRRIPPLVRNSAYDFVLIDCPAGTYPDAIKVTGSAMLASDFIILPMEPSGFTFWASDPMMKLSEQLMMREKPPVLRILISKGSSRTRLGREAQSATQQFGLPVFSQHISHRQAVVEATSRGRTIYEHEPGGVSVSEYERVIGEIYECLKPSSSQYSEEPVSTLTDS